MCKQHVAAQGQQLRKLSASIDQQLRRIDQAQNSLQTPVHKQRAHEISRTLHGSEEQVQQSTTVNVFRDRGNLSIEQVLLNAAWQQLERNAAECSAVKVAKSGLVTQAENGAVGSRSCHSKQMRVATARLRTR